MNHFRRLKVFNGLCLVIVRSLSGPAGEIQLMASTGAVEKGQVAILSRWPDVGLSFDTTIEGHILELNSHVIIFAVLVFLFYVSIAG
jgi:hypothetical protein